MCQVKCFWSTLYNSLYNSLFLYFFPLISPSIYFNKVSIRFMSGDGEGDFIKFILFTTNQVCTLRCMFRIIVLLKDAAYWYVIIRKWFHYILENISIHKMIHISYKMKWTFAQTRKVPPSKCFKVRHIYF